MPPKRTSDTDAIRRIGEAFIVHKDALETFVESVDSLTDTTHLLDYMRWLLPRCWQVNYVRETTSQGVHLEPSRYLEDDDQVVKHIAAIYEMPGRWCPFDINNDEFRQQFERSCPEEFERIQSQLSNIWDGTHVALGAADTADLPCPVTPAQIQEELHVYATQRSALWTNILRRVFFGGTTMNDFLGMHSEKSRTPLYQRDLFWIARSAVGLLHVPEVWDEFGMEARTHGQYFEAMNSAGCVQMLNHGITDTKLKYRHEEVNMVLVPGLEHLFCVSPDGVIICDDPSVPEEYRRAAFEAKCQYGRFTCYETCPDDLYTAQVLGEMVALGVRHAYASFMFYRVLPCKLPNNLYVCPDTRVVRATIEILYMPDEVRDTYLQLLSAVAYYMQIVLHEVIYTMNDAEGFPGMRNTVTLAHSLRVELEKSICTIRERMHALIRAGHSRQGNRGLQRRYLRFRRWSPRTPDHNMVVNVKDIQLDLQNEYFDGDKDLFDQWHNKSHLNFCPGGKTPPVPVKVPIANAGSFAMRHYEEARAGLDAILKKFPSRITKAARKTMSAAMVVESPGRAPRMKSQQKKIM